MKNTILSVPVFLTLVLVFLTCTHDTLYTPDTSNKVACYAFLSDTLVSQTATLKEVSGMPVTDTIHTKDSIVFIGILEPLSGRVKRVLWDFGDGDSSASRIIRHCFSHGGVYKGIFTIEDYAGFFMSDTVVVHVNTRPRMDSLVYPPNNAKTVNPKDINGIRFEWSAHDPDADDTITADLLIGKDSLFLSPKLTGIKTKLINATNLNLEVWQRYFWQIVIHDRYDEKDSSRIYKFFTTNPDAPNGIIKGYARFEGKTNHLGIKITVSHQDITASKIGYTDSTGFYSIQNLIPQPGYTIIAFDSLKNGEYVSDTAKDSVSSGVLTTIRNLLLIDPFEPQILLNTPTGVQTIRKPTVSCKFTDRASGIMVSSAKIVFDDSDVTNKAAITTNGFSWTPDYRLADGNHTCIAVVSDSAGNVSETMKWDFKIDAMKLYAIQDTVVPINATVYLHGRVSDVYSKIVQYKWDFNGDRKWEDSVATSDSTISRPWTYTHEAEYNAILYVRDDSGMVKMDTAVITVGNQSPVIESIRSDTTISIFDSIPFYGKAYDIDGVIKEYAWDFNGNGTFEFTSATTMDAGYKYIPAGVYKAVLRLTDDDGKITRDTVKVTVLQDVPVINLGKDTTLSINDTIRINGTVSDSFGTLVLMAWNINDNGFVPASSPDTIIRAPALEKLDYRCVFQAEDNDGNVVYDTLIARVETDPPVAIITAPDSAHIDSSFSICCIKSSPGKFGRIIKNEWSIGAFNDFHEVLKKDTTIFTDTNEHIKFIIVLRVTDDDSNTALDTEYVKVERFWIPVGNIGFSEGEAYNIHLELDNNNTPYVAFNDYLNEQKVTVMRLIDNKWEVVGKKGFSDGEVYCLSMAFDYSNNLPYVAYSDGSIGMKAVVMIYDGAAWQPVGKKGISDGIANSISISIDNQSIPYITFCDQANGIKASAAKYIGGSWQPVGNFGFSDSIIDNISIRQDKNDIPYVAYSDHSVGGKSTVMKFVDNKWQLVGNKGICDNYSAFLFDINNTPIIAYVKNDMGSTILKIITFDNSTWTDANKDAFLSNNNLIFMPSVTIDHQNNFYVAYSNPDIGRNITVKRNISTNWVNVGESGFSGGGVTNVTLRIDNNGLPIVAFKQGNVGGKAAVMCYR